MRLDTPRFGCGPLRIAVRAEDTILQKVTEVLSAFDVPWEGPGRPVELEARWADTPTPLGPGRYLTCARMSIDPTTEGLRVTTRAGSSAVGRFSEGGEEWSMDVWPDPADIDDLEEVEQIVELVFSTGWRRAGWVPMHSGAVTRNGACAFLSTSSGGGKSTLTAALVRRGWQTLGDDKLLLRCEMDGRPSLAAVMHSFNLHPSVRKWLPEVGDLELLPRYSGWTDKRAVRIGRIWPEGVASAASPTHFVELRRVSQNDRVRVVRLAPKDTLGALLRQTVVPADRETAAPILRTVAATAQRLEGVRVEIPDGAIADPSTLEAVESALVGR